MKRIRKRTILMAKEAVEKYKNDPNYQLLHNLVADIFAKLLKSDMELLKCGGISKISLAAKWCPSLGSSYDHSTLNSLREGFSVSHNLISLYYSSLNCWDWERFVKIVDRQWREMVEGHIKKGKFGSCLAVCFRGNNHLQMDIIASLGLLVSDVAEEPWRKYILVFNSEPDLVKFDLSELLDSYAFGYDDLVWGGDSWEKDYEVMRNKYEEEGYILPELVFCKISGSRHYPMLSMKKGVTILNGHSKMLMKYFLEEGGRMRLEDVMRWAISGEKYKHLVVLD